MSSFGSYKTQSCRRGDGGWDERGGGRDGEKGVELKRYLGMIMRIGQKLKEFHEHITGPGQSGDP